MSNSSHKEKSMEHQMGFQSDQDSPTSRRLIPVPQFNDYHPDPTPAALRWMIFTNKNDFNQCIVRRGRRVLIDEVKYFNWLDQQNKSF